MSWMRRAISSLRSAVFAMPCSSIAGCSGFGKSGTMTVHGTAGINGNFVVDVLYAVIDPRVKASDI